MKRDWTDAKFETVGEAKRPWWQGWRLSWNPTIFLILAIGGAGTLVRLWIETLTAAR